MVDLVKRKTRKLWKTKKPVLSTNSIPLPSENVPSPIENIVFKNLFWNLFLLYLLSCKFMFFEDFTEFLSNILSTFQRWKSIGWLLISEVLVKVNYSDDIYSA